MAFQVSAGVEVKEIDLTNVVPAVSTSIGGYAGHFRWGPINEITLIGSETDLANEFGKPDTSSLYGRSFFTASSFLKYGSALKAVRASASGALNAASSSPGGRIVDILLSSSPTGAAAHSATNFAALIGTIDSPAVLGGNNFSVVSNSGSGAVLQPKYQLSSVAIASAGSGYEADDSGEVTVDLGENQIAVLDVTAASNGVPSSVAIDTNVTLNSPTSFTSVATSSTANAAKGSIGSTGTGLQLNLTYKLTSLSVVGGGSGYATTSMLATNFSPGDDVSVNTGDSPKLLIFKYGNEIYPSFKLSNAGALPTTDSPGRNYILPILTAAQANTATLITNDDNFDSLKSGLGNGVVYSRYAGAIGNGTNVYVVDNSNANSLALASGTLVNSSFDASPSASEYHILVTSTEDDVTGNGLVETEVEKWPFLGTAAGSKKEDGTNNFFQDVINRGSEWAYIPGTLTAGKYDLGNGADGTRSVGGITTGLDLLADSETVDVNLLFTESDADGDNTLGNKVATIATTRKDCVAFVGVPVEDTANENDPLTKVKEYKASLSAPDSYGVIGSGAAYVYDKFNDRFLYIGTQGHLAGLCANTDQVAEAWFSPGGFNRGQLRGVTKLAFNPSKIQRDELYKAGINPIVSFPGQGTVLFGDKTLQAKPSAFDRINVRRLFITLEKAIATAAKFQLFELNDEFTRAAFRNLVEPFLRDVQGRRGITDFLVVCDETNNTGQVIDSNRFVADIFIKPARSINFMTLNFIATRTGVEFSEIVGSN
jgi:hypothetical protein